MTAVLTPPARVVGEEIAVESEGPALDAVALSTRSTEAIAPPELPRETDLIGPPFDRFSRTGGLPPFFDIFASYAMPEGGGGGGGSLPPLTGIGPDEGPKVANFLLKPRGEVIGREDISRELDQAFADPDKLGYLMDAQGGVGKSAGIYNWLDSIAPGYNGVERVLAWSFYNQGTSEQHVSADPFLQYVLKFCDDPEFEQSCRLPSLPKAIRAAALFQLKAGILVADGTEPFQHQGEAAGESLKELSAKVLRMALAHPMGDMDPIDLKLHEGSKDGEPKGSFKDPGLDTFLRELLCPNESLRIRDEIHAKWKDELGLPEELPAEPTHFVINTTRVNNEEFAAMPSVTRTSLETLTPEQGARVLRSLGVQGEQDRLEAASEEFGGHSYAVRLLGQYLSRYRGGDIEAAFTIDETNHLKELGTINRGANAWRVMKALSEHLSDSQTQLLSVCGLLDRPAPFEAIQAVIEGPAIAHLNDELRQRPLAEIEADLHFLRDLELVSAEQALAPGQVENHPLAREFYDALLQTESMGAFRTGKERLGRYHLASVPDLVDNLDDATVQYRGIVDLCEAGQFREAFAVYSERLLRERFGCFAAQKLGAIGPDIAATAKFTDSDGEVVQDLEFAERLRIHTERGVRFRNDGRIEQSERELEKVVRLIEEHVEEVGDIRNVDRGLLADASYSAGQLAQLNLMLGAALPKDEVEGNRLDRAREMGRKALYFGQHCGIGYFNLHARISLLDVEVRSGNLERADNHLQNALALEARPKESGGSDKPVIYSQGVNFWSSLMIEQGRIDEAIETLTTLNLFGNAEKVQNDKGVVKLGDRGASLLANAIDLTCYGKLKLLQAVRDGDVDGMLEAGEVLKAADSKVQESGYADYRVRILEPLATFYRETGDHKQAREQLILAHRLCNRGAMELLRADVLIEEVKLNLEENMVSSARDSLDRLRETVQKTGYHLRDSIVEDLETLVAGRESILS